MYVLKVWVCVYMCFSNMCFSYVEVSIFVVHDLSHILWTKEYISWTVPKGSHFVCGSVVCKWR